MGWTNLGGGNGSGGAAPKTNIISDYTSTAVIVTPETNTEYRYGTLTSLSFTISKPKDDYTAYIVFTSGETPTETIYPDTVKWSGDDVIDGVFTPLASKRYNIGIWYDGENINAATRGVSV